MNRDNLMTTIVRLKVFIVVMCILNFTACSAKNKVSSATSALTERTTNKGDYKTEINDIAVKKFDSVASYQVHDQVAFTSIADSIKRKNIVNRRGVEKRDVKIDSIKLDQSKIYGITISERSSSTINSDENVDIFGLETLLSADEREVGGIKLSRTDEMSKQERTKVSVEGDNRSDSNNSSDVSEKNIPWVVLIATSVLSSWWFWLALIIVGYVVYKRMKGVNVLTTLFFKIKSWFA